MGSVELPKYACHKEVRAAKITGIVTEGGGGTKLVFGDLGASTLVSREWMEKHRPVCAGYYVVYKDGYTSYSPAKAFEDGYTLVEK